MEGTSFAPYLLNRTGTLPDQQFILGNIISNKVDGNTGFRGIRTEQYTLAYQRKGKGLEGFFFDRTKDPFEMNNLYNKENIRVIDMKKDLVNWLTKTNDPFKLE
ncbi:MAG: hypothetical protein ABI123_08605 [Ginsengibacter sp.]